MPAPFFFLAAIFSVVVPLFPVMVWGHVSSISAATAGAGRAAIEALDVPFMNPAAIAFAKGYHFSTGLSKYSSQLGSDQEEMSVLLSDNTRDTVVPTSLAYVQKRDLDPSIDWNQKDVRLSLGNFLGPRQALGFGLTYRQDRLNSISTQQMAMTVGSIFGVTKDLGVALVFENALLLSGAPVGRETLAPLTAVGLSYNLGKMLRMRLDLTTERNNSLNRPRIAGGIENYWNRWIIFRLGAARDAELEESMWSTGLGFDGPRFGIHYAFQSVESRVERDFRHSVDLDLALW